MSRPFSYIQCHSSILPFSGEELPQAKPTEPLYSTVVKVKSSQKKSSSLEDITSSSSAASGEATKQGACASKPPEIVAVMPKLECYEPTAELDTSTVITNSSAIEVPNQNAQVMSGDSHVMSHDPLYATVKEPDVESFAYPGVDMPQCSAAVYKGLKKHDNAPKNVHLVSVKGISDLPESQSMNFPPGSSQAMQPIHYAAASGNKKSLSEILSVLPIMQDPMELVLGTDKMCKREGIDVRDSEGRTALMHAVHNDHIQCVKLLAEAGANINESANGEFPS